MKKSKFLEGAFVATIGIILCKVLGLIYVIPFYRIIGSYGSTLYSSAYSIYAVFLTLASTGIPIAISKLVSEYNALGYYSTKEKVYKMGKYIIVGIGIISFIVLFLGAPLIAKLFLGDIGAEILTGVTMSIRVVSVALLIVPLYSITKGYLQGHNYIAVTSISQVIEQIVRVFVIVAGSYLAVKAFNLSIDTAVGIAVFGATAGAITAYLYLVFKIKKNKDDIKKTDTLKKEEKVITKKDIIKKIVIYALPFILIDLMKSAFSLVDTITIVRTVMKLGMDATNAQTIFNVIVTWATKLNMIVISLALGMIISLVPTISSSYALGDMKEVNKRINQALQSLLVVTLPLTLGISFLAPEVWTIFYGYDALSIEIFRIFVFQALSFSIFTVLINIIQTLNNTKTVLRTLIISLALKAIINVPSMYLCSYLRIPLYIGPVVSTVIIQLLASFYLIKKLKKNYQITFKETYNNTLKIIIGCGAMLVVLFVVNQFFDINTLSRLNSLFKVILYGIIGIIVYALMTYKLGALNSIFGKEIVNKVLNKFKKNK